MVRKDKVILWHDAKFVQNQVNLEIM